MNPNDQARIDTEDPFATEASINAEFLLINVPSCKGYGYNLETLQGKNNNFTYEVFVKSIW